MKEALIDLFKEVKDGRIKVHDNYYNIGFNTNIVIDGKQYKFSSSNNTSTSFLLPTLQINNLEEFSNVFFEYVYKAKAFYKEQLDSKYGDFSDYEVSKFLMGLVWANATSTDFNNPVDFLRKRISFFDKELINDSEIKTDSISIFDDSILESSIEKNKVYLEAPYVLQGRIVSKNEEEGFYSLPNIYFGIDNDTCYVYAIQSNRKVQYSKYQKKIKRKLNKVKKGFDEGHEVDRMSADQILEYNINNPENIVSVEPGILVSLTILLSRLDGMNVTNIVVPDFFPVRYNFSLIVSDMKSKQKSAEERDDFLSSEEENIDRINRNIVDKKIRSFRRLGYYFGQLDIWSYPKEQDDSMHILINPDYSCDNGVLDEIFHKTGEGISYRKPHNI